MREKYRHIIISLCFIISVLSFSSLSNATVSPGSEPAIIIDLDYVPVMLSPYEDDTLIPVKVGARGEQYQIGIFARYLKDEGGSLTIDQVAAKELQGLFEKEEKEIFNFGITNAHYWIKFNISFPLQNLTAAREKLWMLEVDRAQLDIAELYVPEGAGYKKVKRVESSKSVFPIETRVGEGKTYYLHIASSNALYFPITLWSKEAFVENIIVEEYLFGLFFGAMMILVAYNIFLFISMKETVYLYFSLAFLGLSLFELIELGHGFSIFGDFTLILSKDSQPYILWFSWAMAIMFTRCFLDTPKKFPSLDFILRMVLVAELVHVVLSFFIDRATTQVWQTGFSTFVMVLIAKFGYAAWRQGNPSAFFFLISWVPGIFGGIIYVAVLFNLLEAKPLYIASAPFGMLFSSITLSFALADRIRRLRNQTLSANAQSVANMSRYQSLFNNAIEGMYRISINGKIVSANPAMAKLLGFDNTETMKESPKAVFELIFPKFEHWMAKLKNDTKYQKEVFFTTLDGEERWVNHSTQLIFDEQGHPSHIEGTLIDISERVKRQEAEKEKERQRIEKEMAAASAKAKSSFLANMSHEIRTPLTAIIGYSEILSDSRVTEQEAEQSLDTVIRSGHHLLELIDDVLDFSKIEAQQLEVDMQPVDLFMLLKDVNAYFALKAQEKKIGFIIDYQFPLPVSILADVTRVKQILLNLCSNAIKFTSEGEVRLSVGWKEDSQQIYFAVKDTGIGLTETQANKLFSAFSQAESSTSRQFGGTGLGLVISKQLAEMMGGTIKVDSEYGNGSCFTAYIGGGIPDDAGWIETIEQVPSDLKAVELDSEHIPMLDGHILVAEDNKDNQALLRLLLKKTGVKTTFVDNGFKAVEVAQHHKMDLILMDMHMPVMDGMDASQAIRKLGIDVPIVAISAGVLKDDIQAYYDAGCVAVLPKPINQSDFYSLISEYLIESPYSQKDEGLSNA